MSVEEIRAGLVKLYPAVVAEGRAHPATLVYLVSLEERTGLVAQCLVSVEGTTELVRYTIASVGRRQNRLG